MGKIKKIKWYSEFFSLPQFPSSFLVPAAAGANISFPVIYIYFFFFLNGRFDVSFENKILKALVSVVMHSGASLTRTIRYNFRFAVRNVEKSGNMFPLKIW